MKTTNLFKNNLWAAALLFSALTISSCKKEPKPEDTEEVATEVNDAKFDDTSKEDDAEFVVAATEINQNEIKLGQLAQTNATTADAKNLGKMMEMEHTKALKELQDLAAKKQISIPAATTDDGKDEYKDLSEKKGSDFDKAYADAMVDGHKKAIEKFEKASTDAKDPDVRAWAASMLPALRTHLEHAEATKKITDNLK